MEETLWSSIKTLEELNPSFVSVTYGAGGTTRERTHNTVKRILDEPSLKPAAHLTCVGASKDEINEVIQDYWDAGVRHIVGLRGGLFKMRTRAESFQGLGKKGFSIVEQTKKEHDFLYACGSLSRYVAYVENVHLLQIYACKFLKRYL